MTAYDTYRRSLIAGFWEYVKDRFPDTASCFDPPQPSTNRPPVFLKSKGDSNILVDPGTSPEKRRQVIAEIPRSERHRWFRSMSSSQALAQSIFGNLKATGSLHLLSDLQDDEAKPLFGKADLSALALTLEHSLDFLQEPTPTSVDVFIPGQYQIAIECKLTEQDVGNCSRVGKFCDGNYSAQNGRADRCYLTCRGVRYWEFIPRLFSWSGIDDLSPCPLHSTYQLVRSILAACMRPDGVFSPEHGHAVLIYDARNPEFQKEGKGCSAFEKTRAALKPRNQGLLRKCSWQSFLGHLRGKSVTIWPMDEIRNKYGI